MKHTSPYLTTTSDATRRRMALAMGPRSRRQNRRRLHPADIHRRIEAVCATLGAIIGAGAVAAMLYLIHHL
jgi:hypothetical protein